MIYRINEIELVATIAPGNARLSYTQVYSPTVLHATSSSKGHAMSVALRGSKVCNAVEVSRGVGVSGAFLSDARVKDVQAAVEKGREAALAIMSGLKGADGSLRTEVTYLLGSNGRTGASQGFERMCADLLGEVFGVLDGGWNDSDATFALPSKAVGLLMHALCVRSLETMKFGFKALAELEDTVGVCEGSCHWGTFPRWPRVYFGWTAFP